MSKSLIILSILVAIAMTLNACADKKVDAPTEAHERYSAVFSEPQKIPKIEAVVDAFADENGFTTQHKDKHQMDFLVYGSTEDQQLRPERVFYIFVLHDDEVIMTVHNISKKHLSIMTLDENTLPTIKLEALTQTLIQRLSTALDTNFTAIDY